MSFQHRYTKWNKDKVVRIIRRWHAMGFRVTGGYIKARYAKLYAAAKDKFESWDKAIKAADIVPDACPSKWNKSIVSRWLRKMQNKNISVNSNYMQKYHEHFYKASASIFKSWDNALMSADIDPLEVRLSYFWTSERVIKEIHKRNAQGESLYSTDVDKEHSSLKVMAKQIFGSWRRAVEAAGLEYKQKTPSLRGEAILGSVLSDFFPQKIFTRHCRNISWLKGIKGHQLELDFYCKELELGLEFQGPTHFLPTYGKKELLNQVRRDARKRELCRKHGVTLVAIPYNEMFHTTLSKKLAVFNIQHKYTERSLYQCIQYNKIYS